MRNNGRNERFSYVLRTVAGIYLIYLAVQILQASDASTIVKIGGVVFIIASIPMIWSGVRGLARISKEETEEIAEEEMLEEMKDTMEEAIDVDVIDGEAIESAPEHDSEESE